MALEARETNAQRYRRPWYWLGVLLLAASIATATDFYLAASKVDADRRDFQTQQQLRLSTAGLAAENFLNDAKQLVTTTADTLGPLRGDRRLTEDLLRGIALSATFIRGGPVEKQPVIHGVGIFYGPNVFDRRTRLFGPYVEVNPHPQLIENDESNYDVRHTAYTNSVWYRSAIASDMPTDIEGPYEEDGASFISVLKVHRGGDGRPQAVASVDIFSKDFSRLLSSAIEPSEYAYITDRKGDLMFSTAPGTAGGDRVDLSIPLLYTHAIIHLSSDASKLHGENRRVWLEASLAAVAIWIGAFLLAVTLTRAWRLREQAIEAEEREERLRQELDVRKQIEAELRKAAYTDSLTGLPSRTPFLERVSDAIAACKSLGTRFGIYFIDLDRFNVVNDTLGHIVGDQMLKQIGRRLRADLPPEAMVARLGGDEFVVIAPIGPGGIAAQADALVASLRDPVTLETRTLYSAASIGVVVLSPEYDTPDELLRDADIAMYQAKRVGRDCYVVFDSAMRQRVADESELDHDLRDAIERGEFLAYYQPVVEIESGRVTSFEALVRWKRPGHGVVAAADFVPFAESHGLIGAIDAFMLETACRDIPALKQAFPGCSIAVNLSAQHFTQPSLADDISETLAARAVTPDSIKLEITETAVMTNAVYARTTLERLREIGLQMVLDDFGQGHSSLAYLQRLPIAGLKIDRSFVEALGANSPAEEIVRSIVALAVTLGLYTVAEGVETREQLAILRALGVVYAQGYLFDPARDVDSVLSGRAVRSGT